MILLESEITPAAEAFAEKFSDILRRRRVLYGHDPFADLSIPLAATATRLRQVLLNLVLRMREQYLLRSLREEQLARIVADMAGPLRSCAATLLELEGSHAGSPKEALHRVAVSLCGAGWEETLAHLSGARERRLLPAGAAGPTLFRLIDLADRMRRRLDALQ